MKLANWRKKHGLTQAALAEALGCSQSYVSQVERTDDPIIPGKELLEKIYEISGGAVEPNDFYDLPAVPAQRNAA